MKEAAQIVRETVPNYAYVSDFVKGIRRSPLGSFAAFPAEIYRTGVNTTVRALKEIKDPVRKQIGYNSLVGQASIAAAYLSPGSSLSFHICLPSFVLPFLANMSNTVPIQIDS